MTTPNRPNSSREANRSLPAKQRNSSRKSNKSLSFPGACHCITKCTTRSHEWSLRTPTVLRTLWRRKRLAYLFFFEVDRLSGNCKTVVGTWRRSSEPCSYNFQKKTFSQVFSQFPQCVDSRIVCSDQLAWLVNLAPIKSPGETFPFTDNSLESQERSKHRSYDPSGPRRIAMRYSTPALARSTHTHRKKKAQSDRSGRTMMVERKGDSPVYLRLQLVEKFEWSISGDDQRAYVRHSSDPGDPSLEQLDAGPVKPSSLPLSIVPRHATDPLSSARQLDMNVLNHDLSARRNSNRSTLDSTRFFSLPASKRRARNSPRRTEREAKKNAKVSLWSLCTLRFDWDPARDRARSDSFEISLSLSLSLFISRRTNGSCSPEENRIHAANVPVSCRVCCRVVFHGGSTCWWGARATNNPCGESSGRRNAERSCRKDCTVITERRVPRDTRRAPPPRWSAPGERRAEPSAYDRRAGRRETDGPVASPTASSHEISLSRLMRMHVLVSPLLRFSAPRTTPAAPRCVGGMPLRHAR